MIDTSIAFIIGAVVFGIIALLLKIEKMCREEYAVLHKKLDAVLDASKIQYPPKSIVSSRVNGLIMEGQEEQAAKLLKKETRCSDMEASNYIQEFRRSLS